MLVNVTDVHKRKMRKYLINLYILQNRISQTVIDVSEKDHHHNKLCGLRNNQKSLMPLH